MKDVDHAGKANRVDGPVGIAVFIIDHFQHTSAAKTFQGLGAGMLVAVLRIVDRIAHDAANLVRKSPQIVPRRSDPDSGLWCNHLLQAI
jgi:hypothetical protein